MNAVLTFFALILIASAWKLYKAGEEDAVDPKNNAIVKWFSGLLPVHDQYEGTHFLVKKPNPAGKLVWMFTPLAIVLCAVEVTDLMFATDSIPAIFAVSKDPFILFTSNIMAILGLQGALLPARVGHRRRAVPEEGSRHRARLRRLQDARG